MITKNFKTIVIALLVLLNVVFIGIYFKIDGNGAESFKNSARSDSEEAETFKNAAKADSEEAEKYKNEAQADAQEIESLKIEASNP